MNAEQIAKKIETLSADELVMSNDGTHQYGPAKTWFLWERLDGSRHFTGNRSDEGTTRHHKYESAASRREQVAALQQQLKTAATATAETEYRRDLLAKGWDGPYLFIGVEEGQRRLAAFGR